jgi:hypothetical protein
MKKLLGLALVMALFVPANAQILDNVETYGEIEILGVNHTNYDYGSTADDYRNTQVRVIYGLGWDLLDDVRANITFLNEDSYWGESMTTTGGQKSESVNSYLDSIQVAEANIAMEDVFWSWSTKIGRQFYGDEHSFVIYYGPTHGAEFNDSASTGPLPRVTTYLDAARFDYEGMNTIATVLYGKSAELHKDNDVTSDVSFLGIEGQYMPTEEWTFKAHVYDRRTGAAFTYTDVSTTAKHVGIYGLMAAYEGNNWMLDAEYDANYGGKKIFANKLKGQLFDFNAAYTWEASTSVWTPRLEYLNIRGGDSDHLSKQYITFNTQAIRRGMIFGNSLLKTPTTHFEMWNVGLDAKFDKAEDFRFGLDYFTFEDTNVASNEKIGTEWDLMAYYDYSENVTFNAGAAQMNWKSSYASVSATDNNKSHKLQAGVNVRW